MKTQHTQGYWVINEYISEVSIYSPSVKKGCCKIPYVRDNAKLLPHLLTEEEAVANGEAICKAVNNTYGKGINPEVVPDLLEALQLCKEYFERTGKVPLLLTDIQSAINKATFNNRL